MWIFGWFLIDSGDHVRDTALLLIVAVCPHQGFALRRQGSSWADGFTAGCGSYLSTLV